MTANELAEILGVTLSDWATKNPINLHFVKNKFASKLWKKKKTYEGKTIDFPVIVDQGVALIAVDATAGLDNRADPGTVDVELARYGLTQVEKQAVFAGKKPVIRTISLPWKKAFAEVDIERNILTVNKGAAAVVKIADVRLSNARKGIQYDLANFVFTHLGVGTQWHGLPLIMSNRPYGIDENGAAVDPLAAGTQFTKWKPVRVIASSANYTGVAVTNANPSQLTVAAHGLATGDLVYLSAFANLSATFEAQYAITVTGANTFTVPMNVSGGAATTCTVDVAASLATSMMEEAWSEVTDVDEDESPDTILCSKLQYRLGKGRLDLQYSNRDGGKLETSVKGYTFMGRDFEDESRMPNHTLYMLNSKYLHYGMGSDKSRQGEFAPWRDCAATTVDREDVMRTQAWMDGNIICIRRNAHAMIVNLLPR